jgi:hypothetical protein
VVQRGLESLGLVALVAQVACHTGEPELDSLVNRFNTPIKMTLRVRRSARRKSSQQVPVHDLLVHFDAEPRSRRDVHLAVPLLEGLGD